MIEIVIGAVVLIDDRLYQDRYDLLNLTTTEGLSAAEWQMRTAKAEGERKRAEAELERANAALREVAKGEGGVITGAAVIARRALATGGDE